MSVHLVFSSVPLMTCFQLGGPCWRICTSYTPHTTRDYCTTKGYLAHWMREDPIRCFEFFWCLKNMQGDASKCFHKTYHKIIVFQLFLCFFLGRSQRWPLNFKHCLILKGPKFKLSFSWRPRLQQLTLPGESRLHHAYVIKVMAGKPSQSAQTASARHRRLSQTIDSLYEQSISTFN